MKRALGLYWTIIACSALMACSPTEFENLEAAIEGEGSDRIKRELCESARQEVLLAYEERYSDDPDSYYGSLFQRGVSQYMREWGESASEAIREGDEEIEDYMFGFASGLSGCKVTSQKDAAIIKLEYDDTETNESFEKKFRVWFGDFVPMTEEEVLRYIDRQGAYFLGESLTEK